MDKNDVYSTYDKPTPYKKLLIYPATVVDYIYFHYFANCLSLDKNSIPDVKVISMSYLEYLYYASTPDSIDSNYVFMFDSLMKLVLRDESVKIIYGYDEKMKPQFIIKDQVYNAEDFEEIRKIIVSQNLIDLPDETIAKEVRDKLEEAQRFRQKMNGVKMASLEDQIICVLISTPLKLEEIYKLTIRKFSKIIQRVDKKLHYQIYMSASMSGFVEFKNKSVLEHWMADMSKSDKYEDVKVSPDRMKAKVSLEDKKGKN